MGYKQNAKEKLNHPTKRKNKVFDDDDDDDDDELKRRKNIIKFEKVDTYRRRKKMQIKLL